MSNKQTNGKSSIVVNDNTRVNNWDNIRVYSRFRPLSMTEKELKNQLLSIGVHDSFLLECVQFNSHEQVEIRVPEMPLSFESLTTGDWGDPSIVAQLPAFLGIRSSNRGVSSRTPNEVLCTSHSFDYSMSFQPHSTQENVYEEVGAPLVDDFLSGYNATIFVYGQTGSGKTYTMLGGLKTTHDNGTVLQSFPQSLNMIGNECGIILRSVMQIFRTINDAPDSMSFSLSMYFVEIYMEKVQDLLVADPSQSCLSVREDPKSCNFFVDGCFQPEVTKPDDIFSLLDYGLTNRATAITKMNANSSRSHCILCLSLRSVNSESGEQKTAKLFFVDLAGSEKVGKTKATGQQLREAKVINKSLTALGLVIDSLSDRNSTHIPYRDSKLTKILQNSLGGNSRTTLVVCCSPSIENISETLSTLRFGQRSKSVKNKPFINNEYNVDEFKILLEAAKRKIASLQYNRSLPIPIREKNG